MSPEIQARNANLDLLEKNFGLELIESPDFFPEWQVALPGINDYEKQALDKIRTVYFHQVKHTY